MVVYSQKDIASRKAYSSKHNISRGNYLYKHVVKTALVWLRNTMPRRGALTLLHRHYLNLGYILVDNLAT